MGDFPTTRTTTPKPKPADETLSFGKVLTDHMFLMNYVEAKGWHAPRIVPYGPLSLDPATIRAALRPGDFRRAEGLPWRRWQDPPVPRRPPCRAAEQILRGPCACRNRRCTIDPPHASTRWSALTMNGCRRPGTSLYMRPTIIATDVMLGVHPAHSYLYFLICSPVGTYYQEGVKPVRILATDSHVRAVKGGLGEAKTAANYAACSGRPAGCRGGRLYPGAVAGRSCAARPRRGRHHEHHGAIGDEVITPPLAGTILDGVTRNSILTLLRDWGLHVSERPISIDEVMQAGRDGTLREMWGTGTAAVVSPVGSSATRARTF